MLQRDHALKDGDKNRLSSRAQPAVSPLVNRDLPGVSIDLTTELRWFFDCPLPADVQAWFMPSGAGLIEHRRDRYVLDLPLDMGVKQRSHRTLELKLRTGLPEAASVGDDMLGNLEIWRRWSPADHLVSLNGDADWVGIEKLIVKRRFGTDGQEKPLTESTRAMIGEGCDAEIAALSIDGREAWSLAFAAFGNPDTHLTSLRLAWRSLCAHRAPPDWLQLQTAWSYGYPEWISTMTQASARSNTNSFRPYPETRSPLDPAC